VKRMHTGQVSPMNWQPKVSYGKMNHENFGKIHKQ
jgi:hypothetical protein